MKLFLFAVACTLLIAVATHAEPNSTILRLDTPGGSMEEIPVYNQHTFACAMYPVSAMADAWRLSHSPSKEAEPKFSSPVGMTFAYTREHGLPDLFPSVHPSDMYEFLRDRPACDHYAVFVPGTYTDEIDYFHDLRAAWAEYSEYTRNVQVIWSEVEKGSSYGEIYYRRGALPIAKKLLAKLREKQVALSVGAPAVAKLLMDPSEKNFLQSYFELNCQGHEVRFGDHPPEFRSRTVSAKNASSTLRWIEAYLTPKGAQPLGISFCAGVLEQERPYAGRRDRDCRKIRAKMTLETASARVPSDVHTALIVGMRFQEGHCDLLLHNSWGKSCTGYDKPGWACDQGKIWIDCQELLQNTLELYYLE